MRVWIVNPFDNLPAEGNRPQRYWLMSRAFHAAGHEVTLWTSDFSHAHKARRKFSGEVESEGFRVRLVPTPAYPANICLRRVWSHWRFARNWSAMARAERAAPDLIVASIPPLGAAEAAMAHCRRTGAKFVADIMDAWPETFYRLAPPWVFAALKRKARRIYRGADAVTAVARRYVELARGYGAVGPVRLFHHGIELWGDGSEGRAESTARFAAGKVKLLYIGNMGASYDLETVVEAVKAEPDWELDLAGAGPKEPALRRRAAGCARIRFHGYSGDARVRELLAGADVGIVPMFPESQVGVPYKLADYAAAGLRIVNSLPGETAALIADCRAGSLYSCGDVVSFAVAVRKALQTEIDRAAFRALFDARRLYGEYVHFAAKEMMKR